MRQALSLSCALLWMSSACAKPSESVSEQPQPELAEAEQPQPELAEAEQPQPGEAEASEITGQAEAGDEPSTEDEDCPGCRVGADLELGRIDAFVQAACERKDYELALEEFLKLAGVSSTQVEPRTRAMFAGWLYIAGERAHARELLDELDDEPGAALELEMLRGLIAQVEGDCKAAKQHDQRAQTLLAGDAGEAPRPTIWLDFPRALATDARALASFFQGLLLHRCSSKSPIPSYERALAYDPKLAFAYARIGDVHAAKDRLDDAAEAWQAAIDAQPEHADAHIRLGDLRESQCRFEEALELLDRGWQLNPFDNGLAPYLLCFAYTRAGRYQDAARACKTYATANPHADDADELYMMGNLLIVTPEAPAMTVREMDEQVCPH